MPPKRSAVDSEPKSTRSTRSSASKAAEPVVVEPVVDEPAPVVQKKAKSQKQTEKKSVVAKEAFVEQLVEEPAPVVQKKFKSHKQSEGLEEGKPVPEAIAALEVVDENDQTMKLGDLWKSSDVVIFFYPKANTPGCTTQACGIRDMHDNLAKKGFTVYGMSADSPKSQSSWKTKHNFPYHLLSDLSSDRKVLKALGVNKSPSSVTRSHLIFGKGGVVRTLAYGVSPKSSIEGIKSLL